jgi:hypothetical protein
MLSCDGGVVIRMIEISCDVNIVIFCDRGIMIFVMRVLCFAWDEKFIISVIWVCDIL